MAEPLKNLYNKRFFDELHVVNKQVIAGYDAKKFIYNVQDAEWKNCELKQRMRKITLAYHKILPADFQKAAARITVITKEFIKRKGEGLNFLHMFLPEYIELFGLHDVKSSVKAFEEITKFASCEFAVRPFIIHHEKEMMQQMLRWSKHENSLVRRLASEGCRPRLPWAMALPSFKKNPTLILPILENLKNDEAEIVRRSVANNLNDISKDNPAVVLSVLKKWKGNSTQTDLMLKHAARTLLKSGNPEALKVFAMQTDHKSSIEDFILFNSKIQIGDTLQFSFCFTNKEKQPQKFRLEYAVYYVKSNSKLSKKVFQITEITFAPRKAILVKRQQHFADLTTRRHYPGEHVLAILVNGKEKIRQTFILTE